MPLFSSPLLHVRTLLRGVENCGWVGVLRGLLVFINHISWFLSREKFLFFSGAWAKNVIYGEFLHTLWRSNTPLSLPLPSYPLLLFVHILTIYLFSSSPLAPSSSLNMCVLFFSICIFHEYILGLFRLVLAHHAPLPIRTFSYCNFSWKETARVGGRERKLGQSCQRKLFFFFVWSRQIVRVSDLMVWDFFSSCCGCCYTPSPYPSVSVFYLFISLEFSQQFVWFDCASWEMEA